MPPLESALSSDSPPSEAVLWPLPAWLAESAVPDTVAVDRAARMRFVLDLVAGNIAHASGGPFAAAVFDLETGALLGCGVNLVVPTHCSSAHAEIVAISRAQQAVECFDLGADGRRCELVTSTEPCAMCLGAIPWSGVRSVVCGATDGDARAAGFDEGDKPEAWPRLLADRGIAVTREVCRDEAADLLLRYADGGGPIYNAGN